MTARPQWSSTRGTMSPIPFLSWPIIPYRIVYATRPAERHEVRTRGPVINLHRVVSLCLPPLPPGVETAHGIRRSKLEDLERALGRARNVQWEVSDGDGAWPLSLCVTWDRPGGCRGGVRLCLTPIGGVP